MMEFSIWIREAKGERMGATRRCRWQMCKTVNVAAQEHAVSNGTIVAGGKGNEGFTSISNPAYLLKGGFYRDKETLDSERRFCVSDRNAI